MEGSSFSAGDVTPDGEDDTGLGGEALSRSDAGAGFTEVVTAGEPFGVGGRGGTALVRLGTVDVDAADGEPETVEGRCGTVLVRDDTDRVLDDTGASEGGSVFCAVGDSRRKLSADSVGATIALLAVSAAISDSSVEPQSESRSSVLGAADEANGFVMVALDSENFGWWHQLMSMGQNGESDIARR